VIVWGIVAWRRAGRPQVPPRELASIDSRLHGLEQMMEAVAIEVERISEGQRFTTKLLAERSGAEGSASGSALASGRAGGMPGGGRA
jgi:hypothetical protein